LPPFTGIESKKKQRNWVDIGLRYENNATIILKKPDIVLFHPGGESKENLHLK